MRELGRMVRRLRERLAAPALALRRFTTNLTVRCLVVVGVYALALAFAVWAVSGISDAYVRDAFPSGSDLEKYKQEILDGNYAVLMGRRFEKIESLVIDEDGSLLFASSAEMAQAIGVDDLEFINISERSWETYFEVLEDERDGERVYRVLWLGIDEETGFQRVASYALLDKDLNIIDGPLFAGRKSITPEQFGLLNGIIDLSGHAEAPSEDEGYSAILRDGQYVLGRMQGASSNGEQRVIIFAIPAIDSNDYSRVMSESKHLMVLLLVPIIGVATAVLLIIEMRIIRSAIAPVARAIAGYEAKGGVDIDQERIVSELRPVCEGFVGLTRRLEREQAEKQRIIADISHDIKTPLTVIRGYAQAFEDGVVPDACAPSCARALCEKVDVAASLVEELREYAFVEHPAYRCDPQPCDLVETVRSICRELAPLTEQHGCTLEFDAPHGSVPVRIDAALLSRAMGNLVSNACVHNERGTRVRVACAMRGDIATASVEDDGRGISPGIADSVFDPFVTGNVSRMAGKGTGLGLSIAKRLIELNGGTLRLVSPAPSPWSTRFEAVFPLEGHARRCDRDAS